MTIENAFTTACLGLFALIFAYWLWGKITGRKIDNSEAWEKKYPKRPELRSLPYRFRWWHVPIFMVQAAFVVLFSIAGIAANPGHGGAIIFFPIVAIALCGLLTTCIVQLSSAISRNLSGLLHLLRHSRKASSHSLGATGTGRLLRETPEQRKRIGVRD